MYDELELTCVSDAHINHRFLYPRDKAVGFSEEWAPEEWNEELCFLDIHIFFSVD